MNLNMSNIDRTIRMLLGAFLIVSWVAGWLTGFLAIILGLVGVVLVLTSFIGTCPLYSLLGMSTKHSS